MSGTNSYYQGRLALVSGGSQGIGLAVARGLVARGADVVVAARDEDRLSVVVEELKAARTRDDQRVASLPLDVTDVGAVKVALAGVQSRFGLPDLVINCAGIARPGWIQELAPAAFREMMEVNYLGTVHVVQALAAPMLERGSGHIVATSSIAGFLGLFGYTGYCASKFAVIGFSEALKRELRPFGLRVSVLCPPNTRTPGLERENRDKPAEVLATEEKVKVLEPEQVAEYLLQVLPRNPFLIIPSFDGKLAYYLNRYAPWLSEWFTRRPQRAARVG